MGLEIIGTPRFQELLNKAAAVAREREVLSKNKRQIQENMRLALQPLIDDWKKRS